MYSKKLYPEAVEYYTKAIEISPKPEPTYFSNRAACVYNLYLCTQIIDLVYGRLHEHVRATIREGCQRLRRGSRVG
jgi:hypothetical protein